MRWLSFASGTLLWLVARTAAAEQAPAHVAASWWVDGAVSLGAAASWYVLYKNEEGWARPSCPCQVGAVPSVDRGAINNGWAAGEPLANATVVLAAAATLPLVWDGSPDLAKDMLLVAESALVTGFLTQSAKLTVSRPYPYMYRERDPARLANGVNYASFWSGHTAVPMAALSTAAALFAKRHPHSPWRYVAWALAPVLAVAAGSLQILAGNHFPTDVVAATAVGGGVGTLNVWGRDAIW